MKLKFMVPLIVVLSIFNSNIAFCKDMNFTVNGTPISFGSQPIVENYTTLVQMQPIFKALGIAYTWHDKGKQIEFTSGNNNYIITIGSTTEYWNNNPKTLDAAPKIINGSTYVPLSFISDSLGCDVLWDSSTNTVSIIKENKVYTDYVPYSTSDPETLLNNVSAGRVVYINGQYWATPEYATVLANSLHRCQDPAECEAISRFHDDPVDFSSSNSQTNGNSSQTDGNSSKTNGERNIDGVQ